MCRDSKDSKTVFGHSLIIVVQQNSSLSERFPRNRTKTDKKMERHRNKFHPRLGPSARTRNIIKNVRLLRNRQPSGAHVLPMRRSEYFLQCDHRRPVTSSP
ncbi:hypothetical protein EVAR_37248_1 [Eumeta japonica]|uniref:Uncharacterized protein n=1 Tax=Eumeta variegata TaxID=151549 RepID=A0A4C1Y726_EUMVA|nr:hypothetical protein EVAR_37248_1 [Eumeta japonica]